MVYIAVYMAIHCFICSDSDGLIKLWTIKTSECVKTLDDHSDKVKIAPVLNCSSYKDPQEVDGNLQTKVSFIRQLYIAGIKPVT